MSEIIRPTEVEMKNLIPYLREVLTAGRDEKISLPRKNYVVNFLGKGVEGDSERRPLSRAWGDSLSLHLSEKGYEHLGSNVFASLSRGGEPIAEIYGQASLDALAESHYCDRNGTQENDLNGRVWLHLENGYVLFIN